VFVVLDVVAGRAESDLVKPIVADKTVPSLRSFQLVRDGNDGVGGLAGRCGVWSALRGGLAEAKVTGNATGVVLFDVDYLQAINESYGRLVGDRVLGEFGGLLRSVVRSSDVVGRPGPDSATASFSSCDAAGRLGGDEFVVVLTNVGSHVDLIVERIAQHCRFEVELDNGPLLCTVSWGHALDVGGQICAADLFTAASDALRAKQRRYET